MYRVVKMKALKGLFTFEKFLGNRHADIFIYSQTMRRSFMKIVADALQMLHFVAHWGALAELVYAPVLGTGIFGYESSSLLSRTKPKENKQIFLFSFFIKKLSANLRLCRLAERLNVFA